MSKTPTVPPTGTTTPPVTTSTTDGSTATVTTSTLLSPAQLVPPTPPVITTITQQLPIGSIFNVPGTADTIIVGPDVTLAKNLPGTQIPVPGPIGQQVLLAELDNNRSLVVIPAIITRVLPPPPVDPTIQPPLPPPKNMNVDVVAFQDESDQLEKFFVDNASFTPVKWVGNVMLADSLDKIMPGQFFWMDNTQGGKFGSQLAVPTSTTTPPPTTPTK